MALSYHCEIFGCRCCVGKSASACRRTISLSPSSVPFVLLLLENAGKTFAFLPVSYLLKVAVRCPACLPALPSSASLQMLPRRRRRRRPGMNPTYLRVILYTVVRPNPKSGWCATAHAHNRIGGYLMERGDGSTSSTTIKSNDVRGCSSLVTVVCRRRQMTSRMTTADAVSSLHY